MKTRIDSIVLCPGAPDGAALSFVEDACLHIEDGEIRYAGPSAQAPVFEADRRIDGQGCLAIPGLANTHTHIAMMLLRGFGGGLNLQDWLEKKIFPAEDRLTPAFARSGALLGMAEMLRYGVTACSDMYFFMDETAEAAALSGIRIVLSRATIGNEEDDGGRLAEGEALVRRWHGAEEGRVRAMLSAHAEYTTTPALLRRVAEHAAALGVGVHTHVSETRAEVQGCVQRHGMSPVRLMRQTGMFDGPALAAHCVVVDAEDIEILAEKGVFVSHNPVSNLKLASGVMPLPAMLKAGVRVSLGTDGASSNNTLNLWEEMRLAAILHNGVSGDALAVDPTQVFRMATLEGMRAMGYEKVGLLKPGWRADVVLLDQKSPHVFPINDRAAYLAYGAQGSDVRLTMVDGVVRYQDGQWPGLDMEAVAAASQEAANKMTRGL